MISDDQEARQSVKAFAQTYATLQERLGKDMVDGPALEIILQLLLTGREGGTLSRSDVWDRIARPFATVDRYIDLLEARGLIVVLCDGTRARSEATIALRASATTLLELAFRHHK